MNESIAERLRNERTEVLFYLTLFVTAVEAGLILWNLAGLIAGAGTVREIHATAGLSTLYLALLAGYAGVKEFDRWTSGAKAGEDVPEAKVRQFKRGEAIVAFWVILAAAVYAFEGMRLIERLPQELVRVTLQALGILFGTQISKGLRERRAGPKGKAAAGTGTVSVPAGMPDDWKPGLSEAEYVWKILEHAREHGSITNEICRKKLNLNRAQAYRLLENLEREGFLKGEGSGRAGKYLWKGKAGIEDS